MEIHYLNLTKGFDPFGMAGSNYEIKHEHFVFPGGEVHVKIDPIEAERVLITSQINNSDDLIRIMMATDALRRLWIKEIALFIPYLPYARQDRVMIEGEPLSAKVVCDMINSQGFATVIVYDLHSAVSAALLKRSEVLKNHRLVSIALHLANLQEGEYRLVCPDNGAYKKMFELAQSLGYTDPIISANKVRNLSTGQIVKTVITENVEAIEGQTLVIVDDICDGGKTFVEVAHELSRHRPAKIILIVSHGIFSKGGYIAGIDHIYCTDSFSQQYINPLYKDGITVIPLKEILK